MRAAVLTIFHPLSACPRVAAHFGGGQQPLERGNNEQEISPFKRRFDPQLFEWPPSNQYEIQRRNLRRNDTARNGSKNSIDMSTLQVL